MSTPIVVMPNDADAIISAREALEALVDGEWTCTRRWTSKRVEVIARRETVEVRTWRMESGDPVPRAMSWWSCEGRTMGYLSCSYADDPILHDPDLLATSDDLLAQLRAYARDVLRVVGARHPQEPVSAEQMRTSMEFVRLASACMVADGCDQPSRRHCVRPASPWSPPAVTELLGTGTCDVPEWIDGVLRRAADRLPPFADIAVQGSPGIFDLVIQPVRLAMVDMGTVEAMRVLGAQGKTDAGEGSI